MKPRSPICGAGGWQTGRRGRISPRSLVAMGVLVAACSSDPQPLLPGGETVQSSDPDLIERAAPLVPQLADRSGFTLLGPVKVERRNRSELLDHILERMDRELPEDRAQLTVQAYGLLGLVPDTLDLRRLLMAVYEEQVAGFYDPSVTTLFVLDDQPAESLEGLLLHELVHAIQDQHVSLDSLTARDRGNDRQLAARAAIEGHATLVMLAWMAEQREGRAVPAEELPDLAQALRPDAAALAAQFPVLSSAPLVLRETLLFPYASGAAFVQALWREHGGRPPPFGDLLPESTREVLEGASGRRVDAPVDVEVRAPAGARVLLQNTLGALESQILLRSLGVDPAEASAAGWAGDRWILLETPDRAAALIWVSVWDSPRARDGYADLLEPVLPGLPAPARLTRGEVEGRPGLTLRIGELPVDEVSIDGGGS